MTFAVTTDMTAHPRTVLGLSLVLLLAGHACTSTRPTSTASASSKHEIAGGRRFLVRPRVPRQAYRLGRDLRHARAHGGAPHAAARHHDRGAQPGERPHHDRAHQRPRAAPSRPHRRPLAGRGRSVGDGPGRARARAPDRGRRRRRAAAVATGCRSAPSRTRRTRERCCSDLERRYPGTPIRAESGWFQVRVPSGEKRRKAEALRRDLERRGLRDPAGASAQVEDVNLLHLG